ncbi:MAG: ExbD/TolR family protein [Phycisphaerae bacterium]
MIIDEHSGSQDVRLEMTPMIDMVFLLLIFFLVATTFHQDEREMQIALPFAASSAPISSMLQELIINIDRDGQIIVSGQAIEESRLQEILTQAVADNPDQKVTVRGDRDTAYRFIVRALDVCKTAGIQEPYLDTVLVE